MSILIGIDPGDHTGIAVWDSSKRKFTEIATLPLHKAFDIVKREYYAVLAAPSPVRFIVVFEDARQRKWFAPERNQSEYRGKLMGAGAAKRDARIWEEFLTDLGCLFEMHKPQPGTTKWPADYFNRLTGYEGRTSEHSRDAALLVFGRG